MPSRVGAAAHRVARAVRHPKQDDAKPVLIGLAVGLLVGAVLGAGVVLALHFTNKLPGAGHRQIAPFSGVSDTEAAVLAARFRPWLDFDSAERWRPLNVDSMLNEGTHQLCKRSGTTQCVAVRDGAQFDALVRSTSELGAHLNLAGSDVGQYHGPQKCRSPLLDCGTGPTSAIYYHVTESYDRFYVDYWWYLRDNHVAFSRGLCFSKDLQRAGVCDEHEGDWEGVTVVTPPDDANHVAYVVYAAHKGAFRYAASSLTMTGTGKTRPVVDVANGSHAAYPLACKSEPCFQPVGLAAGGLIDVPEGRSDGRAPWARNADSACDLGGTGSCLISLSSQPWTSWPGQWGDGCESACGGAGDVNSPQSPGLQARYQTPWCSTETIGITCDGRPVSCSDWLGPLVQAVICDPAELSRALASSNEVATGHLGLVVGGKQIIQPTTPGVVQALGDPFQPPATLTAIADGPASEILVRARDNGVTVEDRFANLGLKPGESIPITISPGPNGPIVRAGSSAPVEQRILQAPR
jgi:hypothetical protein